ncbi:MAG: hypothetical protein JST16_15545 [Bdellovibrionales bacterium]|nr:hypothetical protein [Bdellovibrionales bacterium]
MKPQRLCVLLRPLLWGLPVAMAAGCASTDKPTKEMVFASSALKASERAQAEKRSPDLYRRAENAYMKANRLYLSKDYAEAAKAANDAKRLAEAAELDAEVKESQSSDPTGG